MLPFFDQQYLYKCILIISVNNFLFILNLFLLSLRFSYSAQKTIDKTCIALKWELYWEYQNIIEVTELGRGKLQFDRTLKGKT